MRKKTAFIIPCFNEEENIEDLVKSCKEVIKKSDDFIEFILVNNGSSDTTAEKLELESNPKIHFVNIIENIGMGNGIKKGLDYAIKLQKYNNYGWTHADLQIPSNSLLEALKIMESEKFNSNKIYIRGKRKNRENLDTIFTFLMACYTSLLKRGIYYDITGLPVLINKNLIDDVINNSPNGFAFDVFTYIKAKKRGANIIRFSVDFASRAKGNSSWNTGFLSKIKMSFYYIKEIWKI